LIGEPLIARRLSLAEICRPAYAPARASFAGATGHRPAADGAGPRRTTGPAVTQWSFPKIQLPSRCLARPCRLHPACSAPTAAVLAVRGGRIPIAPRGWFARANRSAGSALVI